jgi:hypothetical protein
VKRLNQEEVSYVINVPLNEGSCKSLVRDSEGLFRLCWAFNDGLLGEGSVVVAVEGTGLAVTLVDMIFVDFC